MYFDRMKEARKAAKLTQAQIAEKLGMIQQQYQKYEKGVNEFPLRYLREFCIICKVSSDYILELDNVN